MMENQHPFSSPDGTSKINAPERCTGPLYSQEDHTIPHYYQCKEHTDLDIGIKEEEEETYVRGDHQSVEKGNMVKTIKEEEEEKYVRGDQQSMEEGVMMVTIKEEEEEIYVENDQKSMEHSDRIWTRKEEECNQDICMDYTAEDNGVTQYSPGGNLITGNTHHRLYREERSPDPSNPEESSDRSHPVNTNIQPKSHTTNRSKDLSNVGESSGKSCVPKHMSEKTFPSSECENWKNKSLVFPLKSHTVMDFYSAEHLPEFIELYRKHPCLWKIKSKEYQNKLMKRAAKEELVKLCKLRGTIDNPDVDKISKKIHNLRSVYQREVRRMQKSKKSESGTSNVRLPKLWYFHLLDFTADQLDEHDTVHKLHDEESIEECSTSSVTVEELSESDAQASSHTNNDNEPLLSSTPLNESPLVKSYRKPSRKHKAKEDAKQKIHRKPSRKHKAKEDAKQKESALQQAISWLGDEKDEEEEDEHELFCLSLARQLRNVSQEQAFIAKLHMQQTVVEAYKGMLTYPLSTEAGTSRYNNMVMYSSGQTLHNHLSPSAVNQYQKNTNLPPLGNGTPTGVSLTPPLYNQYTLDTQTSQNQYPPPAEQGARHNTAL